MNLSPVSNPADKGFVYSLNNFIEEELKIIDSSEKNENFLSKERYLVFRQAFSKVISYVQAYKSLLSNIKKEYEFFIEELEKNQQEYNSAQDEVIKLKSTNLTISNLENRKTELKKQLSALKIENERLNENLNKLLLKNAEQKSDQNEKYAFLSVNQKKGIQNGMAKSDFSLIPNLILNILIFKKNFKGLNLEKAIDIGYLNNLLNELEIKINDLTQSQTKKYTSKQQKIDLEVIFF